MGNETYVGWVGREKKPTLIFFGHGVLFVPCPTSCHFGRMRRTLGCAAGVVFDTRTCKNSWKLSGLAKTLKDPVWFFEFMEMGSTIISLSKSCEAYEGKKLWEKPCDWREEVKTSIGRGKSVIVWPVKRTVGDKRHISNSAWNLYSSFNFTFVT